MVLPKVSQVVAIGDTRLFGTTLSLWIRASSSLRHGTPISHEAHEAKCGSCVGLCESYPRNWWSHNIRYRVDGVLTTNAHEHLLCHRLGLGIPASFIHISQATLISHVMNSCYIHKVPCCYFFTIWTTVLVRDQCWIHYVSRGSRKNIPSSSCRTCSNPTFCPLACLALEPQTMALLEKTIVAWETHVFTIWRGELWNTLFQLLRDFFVNGIAEVFYCALSAFQNNRRRVVRRLSSGLCVYSHEV